MQSPRQVNIPETEIKHFRACTQHYTIKRHNSSPNANREMQIERHLYTIGAEYSDLCECGEKETVKHVLLDCRRWQTERKELRGAVRDRIGWGDVPFLLGGWSGRKDLAGKYIDREAASWNPHLGERSGRRLTLPGT